MLRLLSFIFLLTHSYAFSIGGGAEEASGAIKQKLDDLNLVVNSFISTITQEYNYTKNNYSNRIYTSTYPVSQNSRRTLGNVGIERIVVGFADASVTGIGKINSTSFVVDPTATTNSGTTNNGFTNNLVNFNDVNCVNYCPNADSSCSLQCDCPHDFSDKFLVEIDFTNNTAANPIPIAGKKLLFVAKSFSNVLITKAAIDNSSASSTAMASISHFDCLNVKGSDTDGINDGTRFGEMSTSVGNFNLGSKYTDSSTSRVGFASCFALPNYRNCNTCNRDDYATCPSS